MRQKSSNIHENGQHQRWIDPSDTHQAIFVHGMFSNRTFFKEMLAATNEIIPSHAIDLVGHGERRNEFSTQKPVSFYHYVGDVLHAVRNKPSIVVGHSIGALAALVAKTTDMPEAENIHGIITISSACPKGIYLPLGVLVRMACTPRYASAIYNKTRFRVKEGHARQFLLNNNISDHLFKARYSKLEDESGHVLGQLSAGIPLPEVKNCLIHMIELEKDKLATIPMQRELECRLSPHSIFIPYAIHTIADTDHMQLDSTVLIQKVTALLEQIKVDFSRHAERSKTTLHYM